MPPRKLIEIGQKFGRWTVLEIGRFIVNKTNDKVYKALVKCDCGATKEVLEATLKSGQSRSCGCLSVEVARAQKANVTHGMSDTVTHNAWMAMRGRCNNPNNARYRRYGGRGIKVCERWNSFDNFLADMGVRPDNTSLDRINNDGDYKPSNCRWADKHTQARNTSTNRYVIFNDEKTCTTEVARKLKISQSCIGGRVKKTGCTHQEAMEHYYHNDLTLPTEVIFKDNSYTITEISKILSITSGAIYVMSQRRKCSLQDAVNIYIQRRDNLIKLNGQEMSVGKACKTIGYAHSNFLKWMNRTGSTRQQTIDHFVAKYPLKFP